jgi:hypothetical protein
MTRLLLVLVTLAACSGDATPDNKCAVKAIVKDHWKQPLAGATVTSPEGKTAQTDDQGRFTLACTTRPASITIAKDGYTTFEQKLSPPREGYEKSILSTSIMHELVPAPARDGLYYTGETTKQLTEVAPTKLEAGELVPDDARDFARSPTYKIPDAAFTKAGQPRSLLVARGIEKLVLRQVHAIAPGVYVIDNRKSTLPTRPHAISGGGEMLVTSYGSRGQGRAIITRGDDAVTEGYLFVVE